MGTGRTIISLIFTLSLLISCAKEEPSVIPSAPNITVVKKNPTPKINATEKEERDGQDTSEEEVGYDISLPKEMFGFPHLLSVSVISGAPTPTGSALANKIITFEKGKKHVYMFESLKGRVNSDSVATKDFLAKIPIVAETADSYVVDFESGFNLIFQKRSMFSSDGGSSNQNVYKVTHSYVAKAETKGRYAFIKQYVRINTPATATTPASNESLEVKYAFTPYVKSASFVPKESTKLKKVGYFENHPLLEAGTGKSTTYITKFDTTKPITFSLTKNIPSDFKQAVIDGVLYWNTVFGKEVLKVAELPKEASVHDPEYNVIQWLDWDTAGFAYANLHADPLTGQTLQGFVYMTSVFGKGGLKSAKRILKRYLANKTNPHEHPVHALSLEGFAKHEVCSHSKGDVHSMMSNMANMISSLDSDKSLTSEDKELIFKRFASDLVRQTVAHEIGHTLGLRHNFAGSHKNNMTPENYDHMVKIYFLTGDVPNSIIPAGTVMDYTPGLASAMIGSIIRKGKDVLSYDKQAIEWGYGNKSLDEMTIDTFCTDSSADKVYADCKRFDLFADPITGSAKVYDMTKKNWSYFLASSFETLLEKKNRTLPLEKRLKLIKKVSLDPRKNVEHFLEDYLNVVKTLSPNMQLFAIRDSYPEKLTSFDEEDYIKETNEKKQAMANKLSDGNGLASFLFSDFIPQDNGDQLELPAISEIKSMLALNMENMYEGKLDPEELELIKKRLEKYFYIFERELLVALAESLQAETLVVQDNDFTNKLSEFGKSIMLSLDTQVVAEVSIEDSESGEPSNEKIFNYFYQYQANKKDLRLEAGKLLTHDFYPNFPSYMRDMKKSYKKIFTEHKNVMDKILSSGRNLDNLDANLYDWVIFEKERFKPISK